MTYAELKNILAGMSEEQLEQSVTIFSSNMDEYYPIASGPWKTMATNDVFDEGQIYFVI